jgi:hypothetical protein
VAEKKIAALLKRPVSIGAVRINPFTLSAKVRDFALKEKDGRGEFVAFRELAVNAELSSLWKGGPVLRSVSLASPRISFRRDAPGVYSFSDILEELAKRPKPKEEGKPTGFALYNLTVSDGRIDFDDRPASARNEIAGLALAIPFFSSLPADVDVYVRPFFEARVNGTPVSLKGRSKPYSDSLETAFDIRLAGLDLPRYVGYLPFRPAFRLEKGKADLTAALLFVQKRKSPSTVRLSGLLDVKGVALADGRGAPVLAFRRLAVPLSTADLLERKVAFGKVLLDAPELRLDRDASGRLTLLDLLPGGKGGGEAGPQGKGAVEATAVASGGAPEGEKAAEKEKEKRKDAAPPAVVVTAEEARIRDGKVRFSDASASGPFRIAVDNLSAAVTSFSTAPGSRAGLSLFVAADGGERVRHEGAFVLTPFSAAGRADVSGVKPARFAPYYREKVLLDVLSGTVSAGAAYRLPAADNGAWSADNVSLGVEGLRVSRRGEKAELLRIPSLSVSGASADGNRRSADAGVVTLRKGYVRAARGADNAWSFSGLVPPPAGGKEGAAKGAPAAPKGGKGGGAAPWIVSVRKLLLDRTDVDFSDRSTEEPVSALVTATLSASNLSTAKGAKGSAALSAALSGGKGGTLSLAGPVGIDPLSLSLSVEAKKIDLVPFQPYFTSNLNVILAGARASAKGRLDHAAAPPGGQARTAWTGDASVTGLSAVERGGAEEVIKWESLDVDGIRFASVPFSLAVSEVALSGVDCRIAVHPDGTANIQGIVREKGAPPPDAPPAGSAAPAAPPAAAPAQPPAASGAKSVRVDRVTLQGGTIRFTDHHVKPAFAATMLEMGGRISGLSSLDNSAADVDIHGRLENTAPLSVTGKINPLSKDLFVDLKVDFRDMELSPMSPYSGAYAGYAIEKGKLNLALNYLIEKRRLKAGNKVFLDQFTFGEKVESDKATNLPVRLAVSLLKDRKGEIRLDLPVEGSLDDPKFRVWGVIWQVVKNLLVKAATSPFALIGSLVGGGEEMSYAEFDPGSSVLPAAEAAKVGKLATVLVDRPALKVEVTGHADPERDREGLRNLAFERKLKAAKLKGLLKGGAQGMTLDNVVVTPPEFPRFLKEAYKAETFPKPRNFLGIAKDLPDPEMEKLMRAHIVVGDEELRLLAVERSRVVKDLLVASGPVEAERVFLVEPKKLAPEKKEKVRDSRVDFLLK